MQNEQYQRPPPNMAYQQQNYTPAQNQQQQQYYDPNVSHHQNEYNPLQQYYVVPTIADQRPLAVPKKVEAVRDPYAGLTKRQKATMFYNAGHCWHTSTPIEVGLFLLLCVAVPFFVAMIAVYCIYSNGSVVTEKCVTLCDFLKNKSQPTGSGRRDITTTGGRPPVEQEKYFFGFGGERSENEITSPIELIFGPADGFRNLAKEVFGEFVPAPPPPLKHHEGLMSSKRRRRSSPEKPCAAFPPDSQFPAVAALIENLHSDDDSEKVYKCMAVIISRNLALTSSLCLRDFQKGFDLTIRVNSDFWSKNGTLLRIEKASWVPGDDGMFKPKKPFLSVVRFTPPEDFCLESDFLFPVYGELLESGLTFSWRSNFKLPLKRRKKFEPLRIFSLGLKKIKNGDFLVGVSEGPECLKDFGAPLLSPDGRFLLGIQLYAECSGDNVVYYYADLLGYTRILGNFIH